MFKNLSLNVNERFSKHPTTDNIKKEKLCGNPNYLLSEDIIGKGAEGEIHPICIKDKNRMNCDGFVAKIMDSRTKEEKEKNNTELKHLVEAAEIGIGPNLETTANCNGKLYIIMEKMDIDIKQYFFNVLKVLLEDENITKEKIQHVFEPRIKNIISKIKEIHRIAKEHNFKIYDIHAGNYMGKLDTKTDRFIWKRIDFGSEEEMLHHIDEETEKLTNEVLQDMYSNLSEEDKEKKREEIYNEEKENIIENYTNVFDFQKMVMDMSEDISELMKGKKYNNIDEDSLLMFLLEIFPRNVTLAGGYNIYSHSHSKNRKKNLHKKRKSRKTKTGKTKTGKKNKSKRN